MLRFFLTMPSRDTRQLAHRSVDGRVGSLSRAARVVRREEVRDGHRHREGGGGLRKVGGGAPSRSIVGHASRSAARLPLSPASARSKTAISLGFSCCITPNRAQLRSARLIFSLVQSWQDWLFHLVTEFAVASGRCRVPAGYPHLPK